MPRIKKKGQAGQAKNYVTRNQAIRKLQISLPDFRKLCIWKGIYPREPRVRRKVSKSSTASTTFYYAKDIQYLLHEPLLRRFREQKALEKKISRALGRGDVTDAARLEKNAQLPETTGRPRYTLDHVVRERYPTFVDAIRDLDDCLSMLFLFANLPSTSSVPAKMIARCERLCHEFQHYLIVSRSLRKSFLSIKGIYYQANIQGEDVLWVVPYRFNQRVVGDIDFRIMGTFVEFYMTLLGFVNFRLYTSVNLKYPPKFDQLKDDHGAELAALSLSHTKLDAPDSKEPKMLEGTDSQPGKGPDPETQAKVDQLVKELKEGESEAKPDGTLVPAESGTEASEQDQATDAIDKFQPVAPGGDLVQEVDESGSRSATLFANCTFFLSRETPRQSLEFLLRAFGCKRIGWDAVLGDGAFTHDELDPRITHQVVDRPVIRAAVAVEEDVIEADDAQTSRRLAPNMRVPGRIYVQPQWVWDSINDEELKPADNYAPGAQLPPHLSPFVRSTYGRYDPTVPLEDQQPEEEALGSDDGAAEEGGDGEEEEEELPDDPDVSDEEVDDSAGADATFNGFGDDGVDDEDSDDDESAARQRQRELEAELKGKHVGGSATGKGKGQDAAARERAEARKQLARKARQEAEDLERAKGMLSKKKRKLYEQMVYTNTKKSDEDAKLRAKRRKIEKAKGKGKA